MESLSSSSPRRVVRTFITYMLENLAEEITLDDLASRAGVSRFRGAKQFQRITGKSPIAFLWDLRTVVAADLMTQVKNARLTDILAHCGFVSGAHFSRRFQKLMGQSPRSFRAMAQQILSCRASRSYSRTLADMVQHPPELLHAALERLASLPDLTRSSSDVVASVIRLITATLHSMDSNSARSRSSPVQGSTKSHSKNQEQ